MALCGAFHIEMVLSRRIVGELVYGGVPVPRLSLPRSLSPMLMARELGFTMTSFVDCLPGDKKTLIGI